jgi:PEP-CTERM motif
MKLRIRQIAAATASLIAAASMPTVAALNTAEKCSDERWSAMASGECLGVLGSSDAVTNDRSGKSQLAVSDEPTPAAPGAEPESYALMLAGLGVVALVARRRKREG